MRTSLLFIIALICKTYLFAQTEFGESAMKEVQVFIMNKEHDKADSILNHYKRYPQGAEATFLLDLTRFLNGYTKIQTSQDISEIAPYTESGKCAFTYIENNINASNAALSDLWPFLISYAETFNYMNDSILDDIAFFSIKYYNEFGIKNLYSYYTVLHNTYQYHFSKREWQPAIDAMKNYIKAAIEANDCTVRTAISSAFIGAAYLRSMNRKEALKWLTDSYNLFQNYVESDKFAAYCEMLNDLALTYYLEKNNDMGYKYAVMSCETTFSKYGRFSINYLNALDTRNNCEIRLDRQKEAQKNIDDFLYILDSMPNMTIEEKQNYIIEKATYSANDQKRIFLFEYLLNCLIKDIHNTDLNYYSFVISNLSDLYISKGYYAKADSMLNSALEFMDKKNMMSIETVSLYHSKGILCFSLDNVEMALQWFKKAKKCYDNVCVKDIQYAKLLSNLSMCYFEKDDLSLAKSYAEEAYTLYADSYGANFEMASGTLLLLSNLALIFSCSKEYDKAKMLYNRVIDISSKTHDNEMKSQAQLGMAELQVLKGDYSNAYKQISEININELSTRGRNVFELLSSLLSCLQINDNIDSLVEFNALQYAKIEDVFNNFSEAEREGYWTKHSRLLVLINNLAAIKSGAPHAIVMAYENALFTKNMLINSSKLLDNLVKGCDNQDVKKQYSLIKNTKKKLFDKHCNKDSLDLYREDISHKEKAIIASFPNNFGSKLMAQLKSYNDVQKMLSDNEIAIEFIFLPQIKTPFNESELSYGAMLLAKSDTIPKLIPLCSEYDVENLMDAYTPMGQKEIDSLYAFSNKTLYHMIWEKLEPYIPVGSTVYYSPTGHISKINLSAISNGNNRLAEVYSFHEVSTTALIDEVKQGVEIEYHDAALYGDINYHEDVDLMAEKAKAYALYSSGEVLATRSLNRGTWDLLPGTKEEVETISEMLRGKGTNVNMLTQNDANEESFKAFDAHAPELIHIATHGFYFPSVEDVTSSFFKGLHSYTQKDYSMLNSGILFAGCNNAWTGKEIADGVEDGLLTADEISRLDLSGNKLIVLSACNTGLGDIDNVDGVFGLQRGLKRAGVKTILMSLWKVPDEETKELMRIFYTELLSGKTPHQSLKFAQKQLIDDGKSPYYWAGFILLD